MLRLRLSALFLILFSAQGIAGDGSDAAENSLSPASYYSGGKIDGGFALNVAEQQIAAAYLPQTLGDYRGAVILLHDQSTQFDDPFIHSLRKDLAGFGWDTLTVSLDHQQPSMTGKDVMPAETGQTDAQPAADADIEAESSTDETVSPESADNGNTSQNRTPPSDSTVPVNAARMDAALAWLQAKNPPNLIFVGHGAGVRTAIDAITASPQPINALVMLNADSAITAETVRDVNLPVLDLLGSRTDAVIRQAALLRRSQLKNTSTQPYSQRQLNAADRDFKGMESQLSKQVHSWLYRQLIADMRR